MGQNHSSPNSPLHRAQLHPPRTYQDHLSALDYREPTHAPKSKSFVNNAPPCRGKRLSCHNVLSSFNEENEIRVSTTIKSKQSSTIKSYNTSQEPRKSEDFDMVQMDENADVIKKRASFLENPYLDSALISNEILSKVGMKAESLPYKNRSSILSSCQVPSPLHHKELKLDMTIGPHIVENDTQRLEEKEGDDDEGIIMRTEICEKDEDIPFEVKYKDRMDSPMCMMESMDYSRKKSRDKEEEVLIGDSNGSSPNRPTRHFVLKNSTGKKPEVYPRGLRRPVLNTSFEEEQVEPSQTKDLDMVSLHSDELHVPYRKVVHNDEYQAFSPTKMFKSNRILERRDGTYQEVEFSFKPSTLSKGSQRYTSEGDNPTAIKDESIDSAQNPLHDTKENFEIEPSLVKNLQFNSPRFIGSPLSMNQVRFGTASSKKSSAVRNRNSPSPRLPLSTKDNELFQAEDFQLPSARSQGPKPSPIEEAPANAQYAEVVKPFVRYIGDGESNRTTIKKQSRDLPFCPSTTSRQNVAPLKSLYDRKYSHQISPIYLDDFSSIRSPNTFNLYGKRQSKDDSKENKPILDIPGSQLVTKLDTKKPQAIRTNKKVLRNHLIDNTAKIVQKRDLRRNSNAYNSPTSLRENQISNQISHHSRQVCSFSKDSDGSYSATRILKEHNILKKIVNQGSAVMSKESKRSSTSLKQSGSRTQGQQQRLKLGFANTFIEQPQESFQLDDSIARNERKKQQQSILNDLKSRTAKIPSDYYRVQIKDTYCTSPMVGGTHSFVHSVRPPIRNSSGKIQVDVGYDNSPNNLLSGTPAGTDSRAPSESKQVSAIRQQSKKLCKNCRTSQGKENQGVVASRESTTTKANRYAHSHQVSPTREESLIEYAEALANKRNMQKGPRCSLKEKNPKIQLYLDNNVELPERPFSRLTPSRTQGHLIEPIQAHHGHILQFEGTRKENAQKRVLQRRF